MPCENSDYAPPPTPVNPSSVMLSLPSATPPVDQTFCGAQHSASEDLLDQAERLLLHRSGTETADLRPLVTVFEALIDTARQLGDRRVEALANSAQQLLTLLQTRRAGLPLETAELLLDAVDRIQALLRHQSTVDHGLQSSLNRRILALST
jgi:chemotaxis protein histidine kinase CheA